MPSLVVVEPLVTPETNSGTNDTRVLASITGAALVPEATITDTMIGAGGKPLVMPETKLGMNDQSESVSATTTTLAPETATMEELHPFCFVPDPPNLSLSTECVLEEEVVEPTIEMEELNSREPVMSEPNAVRTTKEQNLKESKTTVFSQTVMTTEQTNSKEAKIVWANEIVDPEKPKVSGWTNRARSVLEKKKK